MKITFALLLTLLTTVGFSQEKSLYKNKYDYYIFDFGAGARLGNMRTTTGYETIPAGLDAYLGLGYMSNRKIGIRGDFGFDMVGTKNDLLGDTRNANIIRLSLHGMFNISEYTGLGSYNFDLMGHIGAGVSSMSNKDNHFKETGFLVKTDEMINIIVGLTPQFHLNDRWSLNVDFSYVTLALEDQRMDFATGNGPNKKDFDKYMTASIGLVYHTKDIRHYRFITHNMFN